MFRKPLLFALALLCALVPALPSDAADPVQRRPRIGLVLSGGGALGATHIGVLKVLEELRVPVDIITGTSMGSIVGGLYALGLNAQELHSLVGSIDWADAFNDRPPRADRSFRRKQEDYGFLLDLKVGIKDGGVQLPPGLIQGQKLTLMLRALTLRARDIRNFDDLPIRYRAVAADLETGRAVVLDRGNLATAMRASMSVPGVFPPVEVDGRMLVDGGVANNLPVDVARALGAEVLIVVDIPTILKKRDELTSTVGVVGQMLSVLIQQNSLPQLASLGPKDILIQPDLGRMSSGDFGHIMDAVAPGEAAARKVTDKLRALALDPTAYVAARASKGRETVEAPIVDFIEIDNRTKLADGRIRNMIRQKVGEPLDVEQVEKDFTRLYGLGDFEQVDYTLVKRGDKTGMVVTATEKAWAKDYLRAGLALEHDLSGDGEYSIGAGFTLTALNSLGAEWRNELAFGSQQRVFSEFYQPLQPEPGFFVAPSVEYGRNTITARSGAGTDTEYQVTIYDASFFVGREIGTFGEVRLGYRIGYGDLDRKTAGGPNGFDFGIGQAIANVTIDTLDDVGFPTEGHIGVLNIALSDEAIGADDDYTRLSGSFNQVVSFGQNTFIAGVQGGTALSGDLPLYDRLTAGGPFKLSGYPRGSLASQNQILGRLIYMRALSERSPLAFDLPLYLGASFEAAAVDDPQDGTLGRMAYSGSLFGGADTPLGPLYVGYGRGDGGRQAAYILFGKLF